MRIKTEYLFVLMGVFSVACLIAIYGAAIAFENQVISSTVQMLITVFVFLIYAFIYFEFVRKTI